VNINLQPRRRRTIRLKGYDYAQPGGYFVTLITLWRECLFGEIVDGEIRMSPLGQIVDDCWWSIPEHFPNIKLGAAVVMPNHIHGIIIIHENDGAGKKTRVGATQWAAPTTMGQKTINPTGAPSTPTRPKGPTRGSLGAILGATKMAITRRAERELNSANIWQRNYYEHILRDQADWERITAYIIDNYLNWVEDEENPVNVS